VKSFEVLLIGLAAVLIVAFLVAGLNSFGSEMVRFVLRK
jgi:hypothetical protein